MKLHKLLLLSVFSFVYIICITSEITNKSFVVLICSYNNARWVHKNLDSVFAQQYDNFRVIYVDDCSQDGTADLAQQYKLDHNLDDKLVVIANTTRRRKMYNLYHAIHDYIDDDEIVIEVDGDDWLAPRTDIFSLINKKYQEENIWFTYGQYINVPKEEVNRLNITHKGYCHPVEPDVIRDATYRYKKFRYMHLRTFYAWLFKLIENDDFIAQKVPGFEGKFYPASTDAAMMFPMLEMAAGRFAFIDTVLYHRNVEPDTVGFKKDRLIQSKSIREIRGRTHYKPLKKRPRKNN